jgi:hypothetical protein
MRMLGDSISSCWLMLIVLFHVAWVPISNSIELIKLRINRLLPTEIDKLRLMKLKSWVMVNLRSSQQPIAIRPKSSMN